MSAPLAHPHGRRAAALAAVVLVLISTLATPVAAGGIIVVEPTHTFRAFRWEEQQVRVITFLGGPGVVLDMRMAGRTFGRRRPTSRIGTSSGAVAAINGGFVASGTGAPRHLTVIGGEIITSGALWTQMGTALSMTADRTGAWIGRPVFRVTASTPRSGFEVAAWNARQPGSSRVAAFTSRGGDEIRPEVAGCWARLEPLTGATASHRVYQVVAARTSPTCDRAPLQPPDRRPHVVVLGGGPVRELRVGDLVTMDVDLGHPGVTDVFGGLPRLVDDGVNVGPACFSTCGPKHGPDRPFYARNPRTAVGISIGCSDGDPLTPCRYLLVTVDGRQPDWSTGLRFPALGQLMLELGAWNAVNLDGGGSTTMWVRHRNPACEHRTRVGCLVNRPPYGERSVIDAVVLRTT